MFRYYLIFFLLLALAFGAQASNVVDFPGAGTVRLTNGYTGRIVGATALNPSTKTMSAVIDARDKFGNSIRVTRALKAIPSRLATFGRSCLSPQGALVCAAAAAITTYAAVEGYEVINGWLGKENYVGDLTECPTSTTRFDDVWSPEAGQEITVYAFGPLPCVVTRYSNKTIYHTPDSPQSRPDLVDWAGSLNSVVETKDRWLFAAVSGAPYRGNYFTYTRYGSYLDVPLKPAFEEMTDDEFANLVFQDPSMLQVQPGVYPDVWEEVSVDEVSTNPGEGTNPDPETLPPGLPSSDAKSFYDSVYPDGFNGVWEDRLSQIKTTDFFEWLEQFKTNFGDGTSPEWSFCFDLGFVDFGCSTIKLDSRIWPAINVFVLFTALMLSRRLVFGG